jgi:hypothetical protein
MDKIEKPSNQLEVMFNKAVDLEAENQRLHTLNRDLLAALKEAKRFIGDELYEAVESFQNAIYIDELTALRTKCLQAIAKAEGKDGGMMTDEQVTFAGVPIPLKLETILDALGYAMAERIIFSNDIYLFEKRHRQVEAFRERILRMDNRLNFTIGVALERGERILELEQQLAEKDAKITLFNVCRDSYDTLLKQQIELDQQLAEKDARIAELERSHQALVEHHCDDHHHNWTGIGEPEE